MSARNSTLPVSVCTGTAVEVAGHSTRTVFEREVLPIMNQQEELWPAHVRTYEAFELYAGLVQSRAFHMLQENWITGSAQEGKNNNAEKCSPPQSTDFSKSTLVSCCIPTCIRHAPPLQSHCPCCMFAQCELSVPRSGRYGAVHDSSN